MPKGPNGEWRPRDPIACSAHVMKVLTGEIEETFEPPAGERRPPDPATGGGAGGRARAAKMTAEARSASARVAARARWATTVLAVLLPTMAGAQPVSDPPPFDTLKMSEFLSKDFPEEQAKAIVESFYVATSHLQTEDDAESQRINLSAQMAVGFSQLETQIATAQTSQVRWTVGMAIGTVGVLVGVVVPLALRKRP